MIRFLYLSLVIVILTSVVYGYYVKVPDMMRKSLLVTKSMGSDVLVRPDDENSPEFKEYLRQLLRMQANRASSGFSAPSSNSADAYIAKLNRLKLEQRRRRELGLPDIPLDGSYKPEDYKAAAMEMQDPLVSDTVLKGGAAIPGAHQSKKVRSLTAEEVRAAKEAEERVQAALEEQIRRGVESVPMMSSDSQISSFSSSSSPSSPLRRKQPDELDKAIDKVFFRSPVEKDIQLPTLTSSPPTVMNEKESLPTQNQPSIPIFTKLQQEPIKQSLPHPSNSNLPPSSGYSSVPVKSVKVEERKLSRGDLELMAKTLQKLVKHRGGGPFGQGRLVGEEAMSMITSLNTVYNLLREESDSMESSILKKESNGIGIDTVVIKSVGKQDQVVVYPSNEDFHSKVSVREPSQSTLTMVQPLDVSSTVEKIQRSRSLLSTQELENLRENLLEALTSVQFEISSRKQSSNVRVEPERGKLQGTKVSTESVKEETFRSTSSSLSSTEMQSSESFEKEIKLALGLLLKHRGGPGFGHGRLEGKELNMMEAKLTEISSRLLSDALNQT